MPDPTSIAAYAAVQRHLKRLAAAVAACVMSLLFLAWLSPDSAMTAAAILAGLLLLALFPLAGATSEAALRWFELRTGRPWLARAAAAAVAGQVPVGPTTAAIVGGSLLPLDPLALKGRSQPLPVWSA